MRAHIWPVNKKIKKHVGEIITAGDRRHTIILNNDFYNFNVCRQ